MEDMLLVNKEGRVVEVPGELGQELLEQGYKVATEAQQKEHANYVMSISPEILAAQETERLNDQKAKTDAFLAQNKLQQSEPTATSEKPQTEPSSQPEGTEAPKKRGSK